MGWCGYPPAHNSCIGNGLRAGGTSDGLIVEVIRSHRTHRDLVSPPHIVFHTPIMFPTILNFLLLIIRRLDFPFDHRLMAHRTNHCFHHIPLSTCFRCYNNADKGSSEPSPFSILISTTSKHCWSGRVNHPVERCEQIVFLLGKISPLLPPLLEIQML